MLNGIDTVPIRTCDDDDGDDNGDGGRGGSDDDMDALPFKMALTL